MRIGAYGDHHSHPEHTHTLAIAAVEDVWFSMRSCAPAPWNQSTLQAITYSKYLQRELIKGERLGRNMSESDRVRKLNFMNHCEYCVEKYHTFVSRFSLIRLRNQRRAGSVQWDRRGVVSIYPTAPRLSHQRFKLAFYLKICLSTKGPHRSETPLNKISKGRSE